MNGKVTSHRFFSIFAVSCFLIGAGGYLFFPKSEHSGRYFLANSGGAVVFDHEQHSKITGCPDCHHPLLSADHRIPCSECHGEDVSADGLSHADFMDVQSHQCTSCHETRENIEATNCRNCHFESETGTNKNIACATCHDESYESDMLSHDEMQEIEGHTCAGCHNARTMSEAFHTGCNRCHLNEASEKFVVNGQTKCQSCHLK